jgi:hypothetical protein
MTVMRLAAKVLRYTAFTIMVLFGVVGGLFVAGYAFEDLDTWVAIGSTAAWLVPTLVLSVFALRRPDSAAPVLVVLACVAALVTVLDAVFGFVDVDVAGPVMAIAVFATAVALGFLGLHHEAVSGVLLILLAAAQLAATLIGHAGGVGEPGGPRITDLLTTSSGAVVMPMVVVGVLYLIAGALDHQPDGERHLPSRAGAAR